MYWDDEYTTGGFDPQNGTSETDSSDQNAQAGAEDANRAADAYNAASGSTASGSTASGSAASGSEETSGAQASNLEFTAQVEINEARVRAEQAAREKAEREEAAKAQQGTTYRYTKVPYSSERINGSGSTFGTAGTESTYTGSTYAGGHDSGSTYAGGHDSGSTYAGSHDTGNTYAGGRTDQGTSTNEGTSYSEASYSGASYSDAASGGSRDTGGTYTGSAFTGDVVDADSPDDQPGKKNKKKQKKSGGRKKNSSTGAYVVKFIAKCVAAALIFGVVAALTFSGVSSLLGGTSSADSGDTSSLTEALVSSASGDASSSTSITVGTATALDVSDVVEEVMPSIVSVTSLYSYTESYGFGMEDQSSTYSSVGSGIIVAQTDATLYIATNNHVVEDADSVSVTFVDDSEVAAEIKGTDSTNDLAVLSVNISDMSAETLAAVSVATLGDSDAIEVGETTIAIGNALGYGQSVTTGIVSALNREVTIDNVTSSLIQTDAAINPGNSGGALLNAAGEVIGINSAKYADTDVEGMGYAIPINTAIPIINELIEKEKVDESEASYLGIAGVDVSDEVSTYYSMPTGVYISQVVSGSAAEEAGIQAGDILTGFDGKTISSMEELQSLMEYYAAGTTVEVVVQRANNGVYEEITLTVTLGSKNG